MSVEVIKTFEELHYPSLFEWDGLNNFEDKHLFDCAKLLCRLIIKINGATRSYHRMATERKQNEEKFRKLTERCKTLENCHNCISLKKRLDEQDFKFRTLADVFNKINVVNVPTNNSPISKTTIEQVHDMVTQIIDANNIETPENKSINLLKLTSKRRMSDDDVQIVNDPSNQNKSPCYLTPQKKSRIGDMQSPERKERPAYHDGCLTSPILAKNRLSKVTRSGGIRSPRKIISTDDAGSPIRETKSPHQETSPSCLANIKLEILTNLNSENIIQAISDESKSPSVKRNSVSLLQNNYVKKENEEPMEKALRIKRSSTSKKLKQSRLSFNNMKEKTRIDVSQSDSFCGGLRHSSDYKLSSCDEDEMLRIAMQISLDDSAKNGNADDEDTIDASPSCVQRSLLQIKKSKMKSKKNAAKSSPETNLAPKDNTEIHNDDNEKTIIVIKEKSPQNAKSSKNQDRKVDKSKLSISPKRPIKNEPVKNPPVDFVYKEDPVRKKSEKRNLPGWSCQKCKDFYEVAFAGNEELLRAKMDLCSKHRGNFNPERPNTPAGFWDLNMPSTENTEEFNRGNNC